jgi:Holliday junction DNA helicase RuvB
MTLLTKLIEAGAKILDRLDEHLLSAAGCTDYYSISDCISCKMDERNELIHYVTTQENNTYAADKNDSIFEGIIGYDDIKREFVKALNASSPVGILLVGPPGCGKSEFLKQIREAYYDNSVFVDGSYGSKAGIFQVLCDRRPRYLLLDEVDKLGLRDQESLLNLIESGRLTKTTKTENYDIELRCWVFATANNKDNLLEPLFDRFETYFLREYTDDQFRSIAANQLGQEGIEGEELALYVANAVLRGLGKKSFRDAIRIARKCKTMEQVDETVQTMKKYGK